MSVSTMPGVLTIRRRRKQVSVQNSLHADAKNLRKARQHPHVRAALAPLPLADGLSADAQQFRRLPLGPPPLQAQAPEQRPGVLVMHLFSPLPQDTRNSAGTQATLR